MREIFYLNVGCVSPGGWGVCLGMSIGGGGLCRGSVSVQGVGVCAGGVCLRGRSDQVGGCLSPRGQNS